MIERISLIALLAILTNAVCLHAQDTAPDPCSSSQHRQFDFWIGTWDVTNAAGEHAGRNTITVELGGCALKEWWEGARGLTGSSLNVFDTATRQWHQTWVDSSGTLLLLKGGLEADGRMVMSGERPGDGGAVLVHRITWTREGTDRVSQVWETRAAPDGPWRVVFDGTYRKVR